MSEAFASFTLDGCEIIIQCSKEDKMKDICQKYATKVRVNINSLIFLYGGTQINFELRFKEQANSIDNNNNRMSILVYKSDNDELTCPKCGEKLKLDTKKIDEIIAYNNNISDTINGIKVNIENIIKNSSVYLVNIQLKNINTLLNNISEDIKKNNEKIKKLLDDSRNYINNNFQNNSIIQRKLDIKLNESESIARLKKEIQFISNFPFINAGVNVELPKDENIFEWKGYLIGTDDTPYKGGIFHFKILFPNDFPKKAPEVIFLTPIYHLNINPMNIKTKNSEHLGHLSTVTLNWWNCLDGKMSIRELLIKLKTVFYINNPNDPYENDMANEFKCNKSLFDKKVRYFTQKYANLINSPKNYDIWDFTYNEKDELDNNYVNIIFEFNGIERRNLLAHKKELMENLVARYCKSIGINDKHGMYYFYKSSRLNLYKKTIEDNEIENNSLIIAIDGKDIKGA